MGILDNSRVIFKEPTGNRNLQVCGLVVVWLCGFEVCEVFDVCKVFNLL